MDNKQEVCKSGLIYLGRTYIVSFSWLTSLRQCTGELRKVVVWSSLLKVLVMSSLFALIVWLFLVDYSTRYRYWSIAQIGDGHFKCSFDCSALILIHLGTLVFQFRFSYLYPRHVENRIIDSFYFFPRVSIVHLECNHLPADLWQDVAQALALTRRHWQTPIVTFQTRRRIIYLQRRCG